MSPFVRDPTAVVVGGRSTPDAASVHSCPELKSLRERLRAMASDLVASWGGAGPPADAKSAAGIRGLAETLVRRAGGKPEHVGWTMVTIVSEHWRASLAAGASGRRLLLLPDCPVEARRGGAECDDEVPRACGPACGIATIWAAARDVGWTVQSTRRAVAGIGHLLSGQYDGILGIARLRDLEKAFSMLPAFALPVAAVPCGEVRAAAADSCASALAAAAIDVEWVLGLLGVAGGEAVPVGDYLPLLREAADSFTPAGLARLAERVGAQPSFGLAPRVGGDGTAILPLDAAAALGGGFVARGGKFLRPFISLAAFDAVRADLPGSGLVRAAGYAVDEGVLRDAVRAAAVAIEVFHKASLVHDDIEDDDRVRYGRPALHVECGVPSAINAGDYLVGVGYSIAATLPGIDAATARDVVAIVAAAHAKLARGQGAELWWRDAGVGVLAPADSLEMYGLKTSPAFEAAVAIGIRLAGIEPRIVGAIDRYALHVGTGFQVLNDLKDWDGDLENDRRAAGDLLGGRPTLMWALALEGLSAVEAARLRRLAVEAGQPNAAEGAVAEAVATARQLYGQAGVFARAAAIVDEQRDAASAALATCSLRRLRDVLEFLLDLAVPAGAAARIPR